MLAPPTLVQSVTHTAINGEGMNKPSVCSSPAIPRKKGVEERGRENCALGVQF